MAHHKYLVAIALPSSLHNPAIRWVVHNLRLEVAEGLYPNGSRTCTYSLLKAQCLSSCSQRTHKTTNRTCMQPKVQHCTGTSHCHCCTLHLSSCNY